MEFQRGVMEVRIYLASPMIPELRLVAQSACCLEHLARASALPKRVQWDERGLG